MIRLFRTSRAARSLHFDAAVVSRPGSYAVNEDAAAEAQAGSHTLLVVADGLGGHERGEVASQLAVQRTVELFRERPALDVLGDLIQGAHQALRDSDPQAGERGLRTTLAVMVSDGASVRWAHVGDSRLYFLQRGKILTRTRDHSVPELLYRTGDIRDDEIPYHPDRGRLLQALGQDSEPRATISEVMPLQAGNAVLLCSDGWWENIPDQKMEASLRGTRRPEEWLASMSRMIVDAAQDPQDNYTALAAFVA